MKKLFFCALVTLLASSLFCFTKVEYPNVTIFHQGEKAETLDEIGSMLDSTNRVARDFFGVDIPKRTLYVFADQLEMQKQKFSDNPAMLGLDWYIGDSIGDRVLIVSPNAPLKVHTYRSVMDAIPHEYVHTVVYAINPRCPHWINEGVTIYLSNRQPVSFARDPIPPKRAFTMNDSLYFEKHNGYIYADKFIEFVERNYGRESVLGLVRTGDYAASTGKGINRLYDEWVAFLEENYP